VPSAPDPSQRLPRYLTQVETRAFFDVIQRLRDRTLFSLIYLYGLRVSEVALLLRGDVDLERSRLVVKRVKNGLWAERPLFARVESLLREHLHGTVNHLDAPLFAGRRGPLRKRRIQALFARYRRAAGLPARLTCHSLRHSIAKHLLDAGASLEFVQDHLGHRNIRSTSIYARITDRHRAALFKKLEASPWIVQPAVNGRSRSTPSSPSLPKEVFL
jgi:site-specific recombinase XerD